MPPVIVDTHCHLDPHYFPDGADPVILRAREAGVVIPLGAVAAQLVASLKAQGDGGLDHSALLKLVTQLSGRQGDGSEK